MGWSKEFEEGAVHFFTQTRTIVLVCVMEFFKIKAVDSFNGKKNEGNIWVTE